MGADRERLKRFFSVYGLGEKSPFPKTESSQTEGTKMKTIKLTAADKIESIFISADMLKDKTHEFKYTHSVKKTSKNDRELEWHIFLGEWQGRMTEIQIPDFVLVSTMDNFKMIPGNDYKISAYTDRDILISN